jgi:hypothetical protein
MNQAELNRIALNTIGTHRTEVFVKLRELLSQDCQKRQENISGEAVHHIHNAALFDCLVWLNPLFVMENDSENAWKEYLRLANTLESKFREIVEALKDFQPTSGSQEDKEESL